MEKDIESYYEKVKENLNSGNLEASAISVRYIAEKITTEYINKFLPAYTYSDTYTKINLLLENEIITKDFANIFHELRQIGNKAAHVNENNLITEEELKRCIQPLRMVIDRYYEDIEEDELARLGLGPLNPIEMDEHENKVYHDLGNREFQNNKQDEKYKMYYDLAVNAYNNKSYIQAEEYYKKCLAINPMSWEAAFYSVYCACCTESVYEKASNMLAECIPNVFYMLKTENADNLTYVHSKALNIIQMCIEYQRALDVAIQNAYMDIPINEKKNYVYSLGRTRATTVYALYNLGNQIEQNFAYDQELMKLAVKAWRIGLYIHADSLHSQIDKEPHKKDMKTMECKVQKYEPSYKAPAASGCYVATAVYGSYDCPEVWTLRRFRDYYLAKSWYGRLFIKIYYSISPKLVSKFKNNIYIKEIVRGRLDLFVEKLKEKGYRNTPYNDKTYN